MSEKKKLRKHMRKQLQAAEAKIEDLNNEIKVLNSIRPHWALGYTSDGVAAQTTSAALGSIWELLNVSNQTDAISKLKELIKP